MNSDIFTIAYELHGVQKTFRIRLNTMNNADAWHWACCDAGVAPIPKPGKTPLKKYSKPMAERYGITKVRWSEATSIAWTEDHEL